MRELKFRALHKKTNQFIDLHAITPLALSIKQDGVFIPFHENYVIQQWTGFTDKNDKDVYEGDTIIMDYSYEEAAMGDDVTICKVKWESGMFIAVSENHPDGYELLYDLTIDGIIDGEVIDLI